MNYVIIFHFQFINWIKMGHKRGKIKISLFIILNYIYIFAKKKKKNVSIKNKL